MRGERLRRLLRGNRGFALVVAIGVLAVLVFSGVAVQRTTIEEVWDVRQAISRGHARMAVTAGYEAALAEIPGFLARPEARHAIKGNVGTATYQANLRKVSAGEVGPALAWLPPTEPLVEITLTGIQPRGSGAAVVPGREPPRESFLQLTAIVDARKVPYRVLLWIPE